ncbi:MAG TPA: tetraacyldisaccharide 4'-kinase [Gemmatimonadaceae bacterium]|nr:tetraacyldisaccharide 4'-kinase [Gemmatimonadaceae bacterium]
MHARALERVWWGTGLGARAARVALLPASILYRVASAIHAGLYRSGLRRARPLALPGISVGNLTVGGTGKTPVAAWIAALLARRGAHPAIVMRGYGDDEPLVHERLNPEVPVVVSADRVRGAERAATLGADIVVLDDAFQHRRAARTADLVLLSADRWASSPRVLPAGPWREPLSALRRASLVLVTRKAASPAAASAVADTIRHRFPGVPVGVAALTLQELRAATGESTMPLEALAGARTLAIVAIGDPSAFLRQLAATDATVRAAVFPDHHAYTHAEVTRLASMMAAGEIAVCTLKDAVKLSPHWPREAPPLWYVSQSVMVEEGRDALDALITRVLAARSGQS